ncbi:MAG TPA: glycosyltransferase family 39 protein [Myxococcales bacterium]
MERNASREHGAAALLVSLLALGVVAALFALRGFDDNRLTSWSWIFARTHPLALFGVTAAALGLAHALARFPLRRANVLFVFSLAAAACFWGEPEAIIDASRYFTQAKHLELHGAGFFLAQWGREIPAWTDLPLVPFIYGLVFRLFGESRACVQAVTTLFFAGTVVLAFRLGKLLWDEETGFAGGALLLAIPYLFTQVPAFLTDVPAMFFFTLAVYATAVACQRGAIAWILLASAAIVLAALSKYSIWILLSVLPVVWLVWRRPRAGLAAFAIAGALMLVLLALRADVFSAQIALLSGYQAPGLRRWGESFASTFFFQIHPFLTLAALVSLVLAVRRRDWRMAVVAWPVLLLLLLQVQRIRYLIPVFPMLALMGARGLQAIRASRVRATVVTSAVFSSLAIAGFGYLPFLRSTSAANLMAAGAYLDSLEEPRAHVLTSAEPDAEVNEAVDVPLLDLYTSKKLIYRDRTRQPPPGVERSALRFTWDWRTPAYYGPEDGPAALVVISGRKAQPPPRGNYRLLRVFASDERVFAHTTFVSVYRREPKGGDI